MCHLCFTASMSKVNAGMHSFKTKGGKSKRMRTSFTSEQLSRLEKEFARQQYMVGSERFLLASALQLTEAQVCLHLLKMKSCITRKMFSYVSYTTVFLTWLLFSVSRSKSGSRTDASSGANRVWSSSRPSWPNWAWLLRRKAPDLKGTETKATRMRSSLTQTWILMCLMAPLTTVNLPPLDFWKRLSVHILPRKEAHCLPIWIFNRCIVIYLIFYIYCSLMSSLHVSNACTFEWNIQKYILWHYWKRCPVHSFFTEPLEGRRYKKIYVLTERN